MFDWEQFLKDYNVSYQFGGKNTKAGNIGLSCPLCNETSSPDPSQHLGINPKNGYYNCWRNSDHKGRNPYRIVRAVTNCSNREAKRIIKEYDDSGSISYKEPGQLKERLFNKSISKVESETSDNKRVPMPYGVVDVFNPQKSYKLILSCVEYLRTQRGFFESLSHINEGLNYPVWSGYSGYWKLTIIFPVIEEGQVQTWTARTTRNRDSRYESLSRDEKRAAEQQSCPAIRRITDCLYLPKNVPEEGTILIVCEGAIDALKLYVGFKRLCEIQPEYNRYVVMPTCLFWLEVSRRQSRLLKNLASRFDESFFLLDAKEHSHRMKFAIEFGRHIKECPIELPAEDPGAMLPSQAALFVKELIDHG